MRIVLRHRQQHIVVDVHNEPGGYRVAVNGHAHDVTAHRLDAHSLALVIDGQRYRVDLARDGTRHLAAVGGEFYAFDVEAGAPSAHRIATVAAPDVVAPMPGKVLQVLVHAGDHVATGDGLLILEAMKMENRLIAEAPATVAEVRVTNGDMVDGGQVLVVLQYDEPSAS